MDSYRKSIIPRPESPPSITGEEEDEVFELRASSPSESDATLKRHLRKHVGLKNLQNALGAFDSVGFKGTGGSRRSSVISLGGKSSRRGSISSTASLLLSEPHSSSSGESFTKKKHRVRNARSSQSDSKKSSLKEEQ